MEGIHTLKSLLQKEDWDGSKECVHFSPSQSGSLEVPVLSSRKQALPVQFPSLWPSISSIGINQDLEASIVALERKLGIWLIIYIDDILLMANSNEKAQDQAPGIHKKPKENNCKANTVTGVSWFQGKHSDYGAKSFTSENKENLGGILEILEAWQRSALALSRLINKQNTSNQMIPPTLLFYRHLQMDLATTLRVANQDYETALTLSPDNREELIWWDSQMIKWNEIDDDEIRSQDHGRIFSTKSRQFCSPSPC